MASYTQETGQPLTFTLLTSHLTQDAQDDLLQQMWQAAGAKVTVTAVDQDTEAATVVIGKYQAADFRLFGQPDPGADYFWWVSSSVGQPGDVSINMSRYATAKTDADLWAAQGTTDPATRDRDYQQFERDENAGVPYIWLARPAWMLASSPQVHGYAQAGANGSVATLGPKTWLAELWKS